MTAKITIKDGSGKAHLVTVTHIGELIVTGFGDTETVFKSIDTVDTAFNFFSPKANSNFYVTSILFSTPAQGAIIDVYEADSSISTTINKEVLKIDVSSKGFFPIVYI